MVTVVRPKYRIVLASYLVRYPIGGQFWHVGHYLIGLRALGHDVWFYEDTDYYDLAYEPIRNELGYNYEYGVQAVGEFLATIGFSDRWLFVENKSGKEHGPGAGRADQLMREADLFVNLAGINPISPERRNGRPSIYIDIDPAFTQLKIDAGDEALKRMLNEHTWHFTYGENIGTSRSPVPTCDFDWHPTRQPVVLDVWATPDTPPGGSYTTVGTWNSVGREVTYRGERLHWNKRREWLQYLNLPALTGASFEIAMDVWKTPEDYERLTRDGWKIVEPLTVSRDPDHYRDYLKSSRGEFTVAKDMNVRLRSGWFSDRAACYLAAGRPVITQDTGFGDVLPLGLGLHAFKTIAEAAEAVQMIERDYDRASAHASEVAREYFAAERVLGSMLSVIG
jgi:hypothetical protein